MVFAQTLQHDFVNYDDNKYVYENAHISSGFKVGGIIWAFTHSHARNWHPLTSISHMLDYQLFGLRAGGHHFTNVLLHTVAVVLLFLVLRQMTGTLWRSAFVAALFAIHPLRVESVAWVAERKDVLSGVFFMLTLSAYVYYVRKPSLSRYVTMSILFACGLMSKPMLVTVPFVLLLLDYWPLNRFAQSLPNKSKAKSLGWLDRQSTALQLILEKVPLLALSAASSVVTFIVQKRTGYQADGSPFISRIENALVSCLTYIRQMVWPAKLAAFYPHPGNGLPTWEVVLALVLLVAVAAIAILRRRKSPYFITGWLWYLGMLVPVIGLVEVGSQGWADRYTYLPQIGLYILITWGIVDLTARWRYRREILGAAAAISLAALSWTAWIQTSYWRNSESLWVHTLAVTSENVLAHSNLGDVLFNRGQIDDALSHYEKALDIYDAGASHGDLFLALFHTRVGRALRKKGLLDDAIDHYEKAVRIQPESADGYVNLGSVLIEKGRIDEALVVLRQAMTIQPENAEAHISLATALLQNGMDEEAIAHYEKALELAPQSLVVLNNLAWLFATTSNPSIRNGPKAVALAEQAVRLSGGHDPFYLHKLAAAYAANGNFRDALDTAQRGLQLATAQRNSGLAAEFQENIVSYRANTPLTDTRRPNATPSP